MLTIARMTGLHTGEIPNRWGKSLKKQGEEIVPNGKASFHTLQDYHCPKFQLL